MARATFPIAVVAVGLALRVILGYRIEGQRAVRRAYRRIWRERTGPILICANHLTLIDSFLIGWALGSPALYLRHFAALPWNVPERRNFAGSRLARALAYALKCIPIERGGRRSDVVASLSRVIHVLASGEAVLIFPEGGRSRSGRVEVERAAVGVGRILRQVPDCRVLCVYLRGARQRSFSDLPARGDRFRVALAEIEPKTDETGLRGTRDLARQVVARLAAMEREHERDR